MSYEIRMVIVQYELEVLKAAIREYGERHSDKKDRCDDFLGLIEYQEKKTLRKRSNNAEAD